MLVMLAPRDVQLKKVHDVITTTELLDPETSTATAPPLLLEGAPVAPHATATELLLKLELLTLKFNRATLLAYTAPPPPLAEPGRTDVELVRAEHSKKLEFDMRTVRLVPVRIGAFGGNSEPPMNSDTWAAWRRANAPPKTEAAPRDPDEDPPVNEVAEQFANTLSVTTI